MSAGRYVEGLVLALVCVGPLAVGARRLRSRLAPSSSGPVAWIADGVTFLALLTLTLEAVGVIGLLDRVGVVAGCVIAGALAWGVAGRRSPGTLRGGRGADDVPSPTVGLAGALPSEEAGGPSQTASPHRRLVASLALTGASVVAAAWLGWTIFAYRHGMATVDTLWYHMPLAARFVQLHTIRHIQYFDGGAITAFYPANSALLHAFGIVLFGNDLLSPALNLCWLTAGFCCVWAIGRPWGREPHCLLASLPVLATPALVDTQPGGAYDDIVSVVLLMASIALVVNGFNRTQGGRLQPSASALAAAAAGLALGTKYTMIVPSIAFGIGTVLILGRGRRLQHAAIWAAGLILLGGFWYLRNWVAVGNPLPSLRIHLGPLSLPSPQLPPTYTVWQYLANGTIWTRIFIPGLRQSLGLAWWALILGSLAGSLAALLRRDEPRLALLGGLALLSGFTFLVTPQLLGLPGDPIFFSVNVRYGAAPLMLGLVLLALAPALRRPGVLTVWLGVSSLLLLFTALDPGVWRSGFPVAPFGPAIHGAPALAGAAIAAVILVIGQLWLWRGRVLTRRARSIIERESMLALGSIALVTVVVAGFGGWLLSDAYAANRYRDSLPMPAVYAWARHIRHARIGVVGLNQQYPLTGPDISNYVQYIGVSQPNGGFASAASCAEWRTAINRGRYSYVLVTPVGFSPIQRAPELRWTQTSPNAHPILRQYNGSIEFGVLFKITGRLNPAACPPA